MTDKRVQNNTAIMSNNIVFPGNLVILNDANNNNNNNNIVILVLLILLSDSVEQAETMRPSGRTKR